MLPGTPKTIAGKLGLGKILYRCYYSPKGFIEKSLRRGIVNTIVDFNSQLEMEKHACMLTPINTPRTDNPIKIHFLSGRDFWYQTIFCIYSLMRQVPVSITPVIYDDGTLSNKHVAVTKKIFPDSVIVTEEEAEMRLNESLPDMKFPYLRALRKSGYNNIRKLLDVRAGAAGWQLVLDSDMLFFRPPDILVDWLNSPHHPCHLVDIETFYGHPKELISSILKRDIPERINVGIIGIDSSGIDWERVEFWAKSLIEKAGTHYAMEQTLTAMILADKECLALPRSEYILKPCREEAMNPKGVLHHYVAESRPWLFRYGWRHILENVK